jgi:hypothetical protein
MMQVIVFIVVVGVALSMDSSSSIPQARDAEFNQDSAFQALFKGVDTGIAFDHLAFVGSAALAFDEHNQCFLNIDSSGAMWSSRRKLVAPSDRLSSPLQPWARLKDVPAALNLGAKNLQFLHAESSFLVASEEALYEFTVDVACTRITSYHAIVPQAAWGQLSGLSYGARPAPDASGVLDVFVGSERGGFVVASSGDEPVQAINALSRPVLAMQFVPAWNQLLVAQRGRVMMLSYKRDPAKGNAVDSGPYKVRHEWVGANLDRPLSGFALAPDVSFGAEEGDVCVWLVQSESLHRLTKEGQLWRKGIQQGSVTNGLMDVAVSGRGRYVWASVSSGGVMRYDAIHDVWNYYVGERFLPGRAPLTSMSAVTDTSRDGSLMVASREGMSYIDVRPWTLAAKVESMHSFQYPRHDRYGLTAEANLAVAGDLSTFSHTTEDSDSIWTSEQIVSASLRYAWHKERGSATEEMKREAWRGFEGIERLALISGVPGLVARSFCSPEEIRGERRTGGCGDADDSTSNWHHGSEAAGFKGWIWKGDTSSDTIDGHFFSYGHVHDLVAETADEKARVYALIDNLAAYILQCDLYYVDVNGARTKWGRWNPKDLNRNPNFYSERGLNSVEILGYLASAYSVTRNETYYEVFQELAFGAPEYYVNSLNSKLDSPHEDNHSDNQLHFLAYNVLFYAFARLDTGSGGGGGMHAGLAPEATKEAEAFKVRL